MEFRQQYGPTLNIQARVFDVKTDTEIEVKELSLGRVKISFDKYKTDKQEHVSDLTLFKRAKEDYEQQLRGLESKYKFIVDLIIGALHNGRAVEFSKKGD